MDIDLVYNYVNSNDEEWIRKRNEYTLDANNAVCRFRDNHELLFSLRSVEKYAPWIRKIFILIDSKVPDWLNTDNGKIVIVDHSEFMPEDILPCYNSNVIESYLDRIPGLSEIFLYANDDMFFGNHVKKSFFVKNGKPVVRMSERKLPPSGYPYFDYYYKVLFHSQLLILQHLGKKYDLEPIHNIDVYSKEGISKCRAEFSEEFQAASHNRTRRESDIQRAIFHYYMIAGDMCVLKTYRMKKRNSYWSRMFDLAVKIVFSPFILDYLFTTVHGYFKIRRIRILFSLKPRLVCINDCEYTTDDELRRYQDMMLKKFPQRSAFEN